MSFVRLFARSLLFFGHLLSGVLIALMFVILSGRNWYINTIGKRVIMLWMKVMILILGVRIETFGLCVSRPALLVSNHISWLDVMVLGSQSPVAFLAKSDVRNWPIIGFLAAISGTLFVNRDSKKAIAEASSQIENTLSAGRSVVIFPEGTTTNGEGVKPFKSSLYQTAVESGVIVQAVAIRYSPVNGVESHAPYIDDDVFIYHLMKVLKAPHTQVSLTFCGPVNYRPSYSRKDLAELTYRQVNSVLNRHASCV